MSTLAVVTIAAALAAAVHHQEVTRAESAAPKPAASLPIHDPFALAVEHARSLEAAGDYPQAVKAWRELFMQGSGFAARRLGDIYSRGAPGVDRDQAQALRWYREAELRGERLAQALRLR